MLLRTIQGKANENDVCKGGVSCILIAMSRNSISFWFKHKAAVWYMPYMNVTAPAYVPSGILPMFNSSISIRLSSNLLKPQQKYEQITISDKKRMPSDIYVAYENRFT